MTFINPNYPKSKSILSCSQNINLIVHGQGVFIFKNESNECSFTIYNKDKSSGLRVHFTLDAVRVHELPSDKLLIDETNTHGLTDKKGAYYWFSIDSQNQQLYAGIGEARMDNIIYEYYFDQTESVKSFLESLVTIYIPDECLFLKPLRLLRDPITSNIPLLVKSTNKLTMDDIATNESLPESNLSLMGQKLYSCVSGEKFVLDPDFVEAIEYNIRTPGCWCYDKLIEKSTEFDPKKPNLLETYLRITLGQNNGESPGIPYVMEIWPSNHYSPIHNHGGANAIIRVLNGTINVNLYSFLCEDEEGIEPFNNIDFDKDDITWISPTLNQVHQLRNIDQDNTCITIQCYMYDTEDKDHYDYFDYIGDKGKKYQFEPDSDMDFVKFQELIFKQWNNRPKKDSMLKSIIDLVKKMIL